jgi:pimeloyl-ACP methyl ester carboxylesterase
MIRYLECRARHEARWMDAPARLRVPVHLVWGDADAVSPLAIPRGVMRHASRASRRSKLSTLRGVGHFLMLEQPEAFLDTVLAFITNDGDDDDDER